MAKDKTILIAFSEEITAGAENNQGAFTVTGKRYKYVGGPLIDQTYPVLSTARPTPPTSSRTIGLSQFTAGVKDKVVFDAGGLILGSVEG
jgi:hypothetical protein